MTSEAVVALIEARLGEFTAAPVREPNTDFDPDGRPFVEIAFPGAGESRAAIGDASNPLWEEDGAFMCHVYIPQGDGHGKALQLAGLLADLFLRWDPPPGLTILERLPGDGGGPRLVNDHPWWGASFGISYVYHSVG